MTKRIAINVLSVNPQHSGSKTYMLNLLEELFRLANPDYFYFVICNKHNVKIFNIFESETVQVIKFPSIIKNRFLRVLFEQLYLPLWLKHNGIDLLFAARNVLPILATCPSVISVLSMHLNYKYLKMPFYQRVYGNYLLRASAKRAAAVLAISEFSAKTYAKQFEFPLEKMYVSHLGFKGIENIRPINNHIVDEYLLFVSTLFPHKNVPFLLRIFELVQRKHPLLKLIIVGGDYENMRASLIDQADQLGISANVDFRGEISDEELMKLYANARLFVFPSLIEGFGLTVLEAMAHSVPVIASNRTSIPEVVGDAGIILNPEDETVWANTIIELLENDPLRHELAEKGRIRARNFTWRNTAKIVHECFQSVLS